MYYYREQFNKVGWFIPPYVKIGYLGEIANEIYNNDSLNLELLLSSIYTDEYLSSMVTSRYSIVPYICDYEEIISESIEAHFLGLHHISVSGLIPVVEGVGRKLLESKGLSENHIKNVFSSLNKHCRNDVIINNIGAVDEIVEMLDSFEHFVKNNLYINSSKYPHEDKTNRHGILHGVFSDIDYGLPINFYKAIGAIDFLCFIISINESISFFAPNLTIDSQRLARKYLLLQQINCT